MTIPSESPGIKQYYLGLPVAKLAADALLKQGCIMKGQEPGHGKQEFSKESHL